MIIVKIGGGENINVKGVIEDLATINEPFIIVHGANALRDQIAKKLGYEKQIITSISGYESVFSDEKLIDLNMMVYSGLKNKRIVELCQQNGINAIGLSGIDGGLIRAKRNLGIKTFENGKKIIKRDFSGKPKEINKELLDLLMNNGYTPIISIPLLDENNVAVNSENDDIVRTLHQSLRADKVIHLIEAPGFLKKPEDENSLIKHLSKEELISWESTSEGRIKRKLLSLKKMIESNPVEIIISDGRVKHPITNALNGEGTIIK